MATYIISDIHGHFQEFMQLLKAIHFTQNDHLYILGDAIDYGPDSIAVLQTIANCPNMMTLLRGPHEQVMLDALSGKHPHKETVWHLHGGQKTYRDFKALPAKEQVRLYQFLERTEKNIILQNKFHLAHSTFSPNYISFYGHSKNSPKSNAILRQGNTMRMDCRIQEPAGRLACYHLDTQKVTYISNLTPVSKTPWGTHNGVN